MGHLCSPNPQEALEMRRFITYVLAVLVAGSAALAAQKATTPEDLDKAMKKVGPANGALNKAIKSMAWADAKQQLEVIESALEDAHNFWVVKKKDDAIKMSKEALAKAEAVEDLLKKSSPDSVAITAAMKEFGSSCLSCHKQYREQDANQQFVLKPGI
jgi:cytochrome c556